MLIELREHSKASSDTCFNCVRDGEVKCVWVPIIRMCAAALFVTIIYGDETRERESGTHRNK